MTGNGSQPGGIDPGIVAQPAGGVPSAAPAPPTSSVYGRYGLHRYHGNVQSLNQVDQSVSQHEKAQHGPLVGAILNLINGSSQVDDKLNATAKNLKQGLDLRSAPPAAGAVYQSIPHQTLYDSVTKGVSPASVTDVSDTWLQIGNKLTTLQTSVATAIASSQVTWTGQAAEQARQSIAKLGNQSGQAGQSAQLAGVLTAQQSEALTTAKNSVPPPPKPAFNAATAQQHLQTIQDPIAFAKQAATDKATAAAQVAAHQQAAHIVQQYDHTVSQTSASMPAFAPAPPPAKPVGPPATPTVPPPVIGGPPPGTGPTSPGSTDPGTKFHSPGTGTTPGTTPVVHTFTPPTTVPTQTTTTSGFVPPPTTGTGTFVPPPGTVLPGTGLPGTTSGGLTGDIPIGTFGSGGFGSGGLGSGEAGAFGGVGSGGVGSSSGSGGAGAGGTGSGSAGARSGVGSSAGAAGEEAGMAEGTAGARGGAGSTGAGGMGAGRGGQRGQADAEHKRPSWLLETDEGIFGTDEMTAPPVIGE
jgi:hypothetical protein